MTEEERKYRRYISTKKYRLAHPEVYRKASRKWQLKNTTKFKADHAAWRRKNSDKRAAAQNRRKSQQLRAVPKWANDFFIKEIYHLASLRTKMLGYKWHVDHIVPLRSPIVCGLHVENNLQVIPASKNISKHNRYWPEMP